MITVAIFQYPHQAHMIQSKLEAEGITVFLKDELTVQSHNFLSNAVGGVKLQLKESELELALPYLKSMGVAIQYKEESAGFLNRLGAKSKKIPILKNWAPEIRAIFLLAISIFSVIVILESW